MKTYSSYKDSEIEWIGKIPSHWEIVKTGYLSELLTGHPWKSSDFSYKDGIKIVRGENVSEGFLRWGSRTRKWNKEVVKEDTYYLNHGDIVIGMDGSKVGKNYVLITEDDLPLLLHQRMCRVRTNKELNSHLLKYFIGSKMFHYYIDISKTDPMVPHITQKNIFDYPISLPPIEEQKSIVSYLDKKTSKIDRLLQSKQLKIDLLKEKRTSLINQVITKGLNPDVETKNSGVEWIGEIPNHWNHSKLGFYTTKIGSGSTPRGGSEVYVDSGIPFIRSQNVHFSGLDLEDVSYIPPEIHESMSNTIVQKNDVLLNITGGSIGRCCHVNLDQEMNVNQHVSILRTNESVNSSFLNYLLSSDIGQSQVIYNISGGNREGLTIEGISNFRITIPPINDQIEIVDYLDSETKTINNTIGLEQKKIDLLKEYKDSLISEVVTGKINVQQEVLV